MNLLNNFLFQQCNTQLRREYFLYSLLFTVSFLLITGPYHVLVTKYSSILHTGRITWNGLFDFILLDPSFYNFFRYLPVFFCLLSVPKKTRVFALIFAFLSFHLFQYLHYKLTPYAWNYNTHLSFFMLVLIISYSFDQSKHNQLLRSFSLSFPLLYIGVLYFQAGMSKLIHGGLDWIFSGRTILQFSYFLGTDFGKNVISFPYIAQVTSFISVLFELSIIFLLFFPKIYRPLGLTLIAFHLGIMLIMNISFWHLIILFPALFFIGKPSFVPK